MNHDLIKPTELTIKDKKKIVKGNVSRAALYARSKVVIVETAEKETYYLLYYGNALIYGEQLEPHAEESFISQAFQDGIAIEAPNPLLTALIPQSTVTLPQRNKLFSQLQNQFSPQEIAYIATTLDAFFTKDQLEKVIEKIFLHYRRNGNFMKSFQILQILTAFLPDLKSALERMHSHDYYTYQNFYDSSSLPTILKKDPLYVELHCFKNRLNPELRNLFEKIVQSRNDSIDLMLLWLENGAKSRIDEYTRLALQLVTLPEWIFILTKTGVNPFQVLPEARLAVEKMLHDGEYETAALHLLPFMNDLPKNYEGIMKILWENLDAEFIVTYLEEFLTVLIEGDEGIQQTEAKIHQLAVLLLEGVELPAAFETLQPVEKILPNSLVLGKLKHMMELAEDPDHMMELGDLYAEFQQFDRALDCYFWEMELRPQDPAPVLKISKCYSKKGMAQDSEIYQDIFVQLKNNQADGYSA